MTRLYLGMRSSIHFRSKSRSAAWCFISDSLWSPHWSHNNFRVVFELRFSDLNNRFWKKCYEIKNYHKTKQSIVFVVVLGHVGERLLGRIWLRSWRLDRYIWSLVLIESILLKWRHVDNRKLEHLVVFKSDSRFWVRNDFSLVKSFFFNLFKSFWFEFFEFRSRNWTRCRSFFELFFNFRRFRSWKIW